MTEPHDRPRFYLCVSAGSYPVSLESWKLYRGLPDPDAEGHGLVRVVDESGDDYLYPAGLFVAIDLPAAAVEALTAGTAA